MLCNKCQKEFQPTKSKVDMVFCDPPYNVAYGESMKDKIRGNELKIENDKMDAPEWAKFIDAFMKRIHERTNGAVYICMSTKEWPSVQQAFVTNGFHWSDTIIWAKSSFTMERADYQRQFEPMIVGRPREIKAEKGEPILYGWPNDINHKWNGGRDEGDVWFFKRPHKNPLHPMQKPVELVAKAVALSSQPDDTVLDIFAGGGSTMIACERLKRKARLVELSPKFCDAILARYVGHTKNKSMKRNGEPIEWTGPEVVLTGVHA